MRLIQKANVNFACCDFIKVSDCGTIDEFVAQHDLRAQVPWTAALYFQSTQCDFRPAGNGHGVIVGPTTVLISKSTIQKLRLMSSAGENFYM